ncbi:hypothetical protein DMN77_11815 [Paenibacillus sp. 79R4]|uniref:hypothetical protein n=1 Tax=Paenibacillus sp. 79R4 TaxID=2212847 RepID=UPI0015B94086|nr:hypothetical protein [Paenibacillus sp. 79R4]NWL88276.1 hypothetical protein [Paenibacillus sp. 79R4]
MIRLFIKLLRDINHSVGQLTAFVLVITVGAFFCTGLITLSGNLGGCTEDYFAEHHLSDLNVHYTRISKDGIADLNKIKGIHKMEGHYTLDATQVFKNDKATLKIYSLPATNEINTPAIFKGNMPSKKDDLLLDSHYAKEHHIQVGDKITINTNEKNLEFIISGLIKNVEYTKENGIQDYKSYGVAYITQEAIPGIIDSFFMIEAEKDYDNEQIAEVFKAQSKLHPYWDQVSKERTFNDAQITHAIHNNKLMSRVIPFVLFIIEALILFLMMSRMIDSQRNQVGIGKALSVKI